MEKSMPIAIVAVVISVVAIASAFVLKPTLAVGEGGIGTDELANGSVTDDKIAGIWKALGVYKHSKNEFSSRFAPFYRTFNDNQ